MKLVIIVEEFDIDKEYLEYHLAKELTREGHTIYIFTFGSDNRIESSNSKNFQVIRLAALLSLYGYHFPSPKSLRYINEFLENERPDIVHCQPIDTPLALYFLSLQRRFNYRIVGSIMSQLNLIFSPWNIVKKILFPISKIVIARYAARRTDVLFAKTNGLAKVISRSYGVPKEKFRIIPLGTNPDQYKFDPSARSLLRKQLGIAEDCVLIGYSGKIDSTKGLDLLIRALPTIASEKMKVKLLIMGSGDSSYIEYLKQLAKELKVPHNIIFHSWVQKAMLPKYRFQ